jgi:nucleotide-binding universal stress UspA family protein
MALSRVVVGTDFSESSTAVARWVARHLADEGEVVLAHAIELPQLPAFLRGLLPSAESVANNARYGAEQRLRELATSLQHAAVRAELRFAGSAETLLAVARDLDAELIVVGGPGGRKGVWGLLGSTSERLVRTSNVPVLVGRGLADAVPASILAPLDASPISAEVLAWSRRLARRFGARVTACYAIDALQAYGRIRTPSAAGRAGELEQEMRARARSWMRRLLEQAGFAPDEAAVEVMAGDPRNVIPVLADHAEAELIVMGSRGAGAVGRAFLGSVANAVLGTTTYPVLIVPERSEPRPA